MAEQESKDDDGALDEETQEVGKDNTLKENDGENEHKSEAKENLLEFEDVELESKTAIDADDTGALGHGIDSHVDGELPPNAGIETSTDVMNENGVAEDTAFDLTGDTSVPDGWQTTGDQQERDGVIRVDEDQGLALDDDLATDNLTLGTDVDNDETEAVSGKVDDQDTQVDNQNEVNSADNANVDSIANEVTADDVIALEERHGDATEGEESAAEGADLASTNNDNEVEVDDGTDDVASEVPRKSNEANAEDAEEMSAKLLAEDTQVDAVDSTINVDDTVADTLELGEIEVAADANVGDEESVAAEDFVAADDEDLQDNVDDVTAAGDDSITNTMEVVEEESLSESTAHIETSVTLEAEEATEPEDTISEAAISKQIAEIEADVSDANATDTTSVLDGMQDVNDIGDGLKEDELETGEQTDTVVPDENEKASDDLEEPNLDQQTVHDSEEAAHTITSDGGRSAPDEEITEETGDKNSNTDVEGDDGDTATELQTQVDDDEDDAEKTIDLNLDVDTSDVAVSENFTNLNGAENLELNASEGQGDADNGDSDKHASETASVEAEVSVTTDAMATDEGHTDIADEPAVVDLQQFKDAEVNENDENENAITLLDRNHDDVAEYDVNISDTITTDGEVAEASTSNMLIVEDEESAAVEKTAVDVLSEQTDGMAESELEARDATDAHDVELDGTDAEKVVGNESVDNTEADDAIVEMDNDEAAVADMAGDEDVDDAEAAEVDTAEAEDVDNVEVEDAGNAEAAEVDDAEAAVVDTAEDEEVDNAEAEDVDTAEDNAEAEVDDAEAEDMDNAEAAEVDMAEDEDVDDAEAAEVDTAEAEDVDNAEVAEVDDAEVAVADTAEDEEVDNAEAEDVDTAGVTDVDDAEAADVDDAEAAEVDTAEAADVDDAEAEDVDNAEDEKVDDAEAADIENAEAEDASIADTDKKKAATEDASGILVVEEEQPEQENVQGSAPEISNTDDVEADQADAQDETTYGDLDGGADIDAVEKIETNKVDISDHNEATDVSSVTEPDAETKVAKAEDTQPLDDVVSEGVGAVDASKSDAAFEDASDMLVIEEDKSQHESALEIPRTDDADEANVDDMDEDSVLNEGTGAYAPEKSEVDDAIATSTHSATDVSAGVAEAETELGNTTDLHDAGIVSTEAANDIDAFNAAAENASEKLDNDTCVTDLAASDDRVGATDKVTTDAVNTDHLGTQEDGAEHGGEDFALATELTNTSSMQEVVEPSTDGKNTDDNDKEHTPDAEASVYGGDPDVPNNEDGDKRRGFKDRADVEQDEKPDIQGDKAVSADGVDADLDTDVGNVNSQVTVDDSLMQEAHGDLAVPKLSEDKPVNKTDPDGSESVEAERVEDNVPQIARTTSELSSESSIVRSALKRRRSDEFYSDIKGNNSKRIKSMQVVANGSANSTQPKASSEVQEEKKALASPASSNSSNAADSKVTFKQPVATVVSRRTATQADKPAGLPEQTQTTATSIPSTSKQTLGPASRTVQKSTAISLQLASESQNSTGTDASTTALETRAASESASASGASDSSAKPISLDAQSNESNIQTPAAATGIDLPACRPRPSPSNSSGSEPTTPVSLPPLLSTITLSPRLAIQRLSPEQIGSNKVISPVRSTPAAAFHSRTPDTAQKTSMMEDKPSHSVTPPPSARRTPLRRRPRKPVAGGSTAKIKAKGGSWRTINLSPMPSFGMGGFASRPRPKSAPAKKTTTKSSAAPTPAKRTKATSSSTGKQQRTKRITSWLLVGGEPTFKKNLTAQTDKTSTWDVWNGLPRIDKEREEHIVPVGKSVAETSDSANDSGKADTDEDVPVGDDMATLMKTLEAEKQKWESFFDKVVDDLSETLTDNVVSKPKQSAPAKTAATSKEAAPASTSTQNKSSVSKNAPSSKTGAQKKTISTSAVAAAAPVKRSRVVRLNTSSPSGAATKRKTPGVGAAKKARLNATSQRTPKKTTSNAVSARTKKAQTTKTVQRVKPQVTKQTKVQATKNAQGAKRHAAKKALTTPNAKAQRAKAQATKKALTAKAQATKKAQLAKAQAVKKSQLAKAQATKKALVAKAQAAKKSQLAKAQATKKALAAKAQAAKKGQTAKVQATKKAQLAKAQAAKKALAAKTQAVKRAQATKKAQIGKAQAASKSQPKQTQVDKKAGMSRAAAETASNRQNSNPRKRSAPGGRGRGKGRGRGRGRGRGPKRARLAMRRQKSQEERAKERKARFGSPRNATKPGGGGGKKN